MLSLVALYRAMRLRIRIVRCQRPAIHQKHIPCETKARFFLLLFIDSQASNLKVSKRGHLHTVICVTAKRYDSCAQAALVSQCSTTVRHCSCDTRCSATPFYDIDMANLRCYTPPPKRTEMAAIVPFLRPFQGCSATVMRHCKSTRPKMLHKCSATAAARHPWCTV